MNAYQAGQKLLCGDYDCYTPTGAARFKKAGRWYTTPQYGDVVYFYNSSLGRIGHVGVVKSVSESSKTFSTDEGNTSSTEFTCNGGTVASHTYSYANVGGKNRVQGFGRPVFSSQTCSAQQFVDAAESWLGYEEKKSNGTEAQLKDKHWNPGENNYTYFGKWYGVNPGQWCQMYVSYCAYQACSDAQTKYDWQKIDGAWYYFVDGYPVCGKWKEINGRWYVFDASGKMITGWFGSEDGWYVLADDGGMLASQWYEDKGKQYYLTASGLMATDAYVKAEMSQNGKTMYYYVGKDGVWDPSVFTADIPVGADVVV